MKRRYVAMLMSAVMVCSQFSSLTTTVMAEEMIAEQSVMPAANVAEDPMDERVSLSEEPAEASLDAAKAEDAFSQETDETLLDEEFPDTENMTVRSDTEDDVFDETEAAAAEQAVSLNIEGSELFIEGYEEVDESVIGADVLSDDGLGDVDQTVESREIWGIPWVDEDVVKGWDAWINLQQTYDGAEYNGAGEEIRRIQARVTDLEIVNPKDSEALIVTDRDENGISLRANDYGSATVCLTCEMIPEDEEEPAEFTYAFSVNVGGDRWEIELSETDGNVNGHTELRAGESVTLAANVNRSSEDGEEEWPAYRVDWTLRTEDGEESALVMSPNQDGTCTFTAEAGEQVSGEFTAEARVLVAADEEPGSDASVERAYTQWHISVQEGRYRITVDTYGTQYLEPGESVEVNPVLEWTDADGTETVENVTWNWEDWDSDALAITDADGKELSPEDASGKAPFTVTKWDNVWTDIRLRAYVPGENEDNQVAEQRFVFRDLNYDVWFDDLRGGGYTWVFSDEGQYDLSLNTENLSGRNVKIEWTLGESDDEGTILKTVPETVYSVSGDQASITVNGAALAGWMEENGVEGGVDIQAVVLAGGVEVEWERTWLELAEPRYEYGFEFEDGERTSRLPYGDIWINREIDYYEESAAYPHGSEELFVTVTHVAVKVTDGAEKAVTSEWIDNGDEGAGWNLHMYSPCEAEVTITYTDVSGSTQTRMFYLSVVGDQYYVHITKQPDSSNLLPGETMTLRARAGHDIVDQEGTDDDENAVIVWSVDAEDGSNPAAVALTTEDGAQNEDGTVTGRSCVVTATKDAENMGGVRVWATAYVPDEEGTLVEAAANEVWLEVHSYQILDRSEEGGSRIPQEQYVTYGEVLKLQPTLYTAGEDGSSLYDGEIYYRWEYNGGILDISPDEMEISAEEEPYFEIRRHGDGWTEARLIAEIKNEDGDYEEVTSRSWYFNDLDRNMWMDGLRENGWTWVYTDEDYTLRLGMAEGLIQDGRTVEWKLYVPSEDAPRAVLENSKRAVYYTVSENGTEVTLHGAEIADWLEKHEDMNDLQVSAEVKYVPEAAEGEEPETETLADCSIGLEIREPSERWEDQETDALLLGRSFYYDDSTMHQYIENSTYPYEEEFVWTITDITSSDDVVLYPHYNEETDQWVVDARSCGDATLTYTVRKDGEQKTLSFEKTVIGAYYNLNVNRSTDTSVLLPGGVQALQPVVYRITSTENEEGSFDISGQIVQQDAYSVEYINEAQWLLDVSENGYVTTKDETGYGWVTVVVTMNPEDGETEGERLKYGVDFHVQDFYVDLKLDQFYTAQPGGTITIRPEGVMVGGENDGTTLPAQIESWEILDGEGAITLSKTEDGTVTVTPDTQEDGVRGVIRFYTEVTNLYGETGRWESDVYVSFCSHGEEAMSEWEIAAWPDCVTPGKQQRYCTKCSSYEETREIPALGHDVNEWTDVKAATCTEAGKRKGVCSRCGAEETVAVPALGHIGGTATCTEKATCTRCGQKYGELKAHTAGAWTTTKAATCTAAGAQVQKCTVCGKVLQTKTIAATGHTWSAWATMSTATVFAPESQKRTCFVCRASETRTVGAALTPTIKLNATSLPLKVKQSTAKVKVSGLAAGDSVKSWKSSNKKVVTVNSAGKITAKGKAGQKATVTVTLASGKTASVKVTLQKNAVKTTKISGLSKSIKLAKGKKQTLKPVITPITSLEKVTYTSSNKSVATVTGKGVVTAKKAGTAKITVKSGSKKFVVKVTVPKTAATAINKVSTALSLKKGKTYKLKAKLAPSNSDDKLTYSTSNKKVATVDKNGKITAKKTGKATITVKAGKISVKCVVTVK